MKGSGFDRWWRSNGGFFLACALAVGSLVGAYSNHFDNGFHFDDSHVIVDNLAIRSLGNLGEFFTDANTFTARRENASYRPLLTLSFALDYRRAGGLVPRVFHTTQFGLLLSLGALLVVFFRHLCDVSQPSPWNRYIALFAATLFSIHTANTETINYFSCRSDLVASVGVVLAFVIYTSWPRGRSTYLYLVPVVIGGLAKPLTVMFGPLLLCYCYLFEQQGSLVRPWQAAKWRKAVAAVRTSLPALVVGLLLFNFLAGMASESLRYAVISRWDYLRSQPFVWWHYFRLFFYPVGLTADTDWSFSTSWSDIWLWIGVLFLVGLGGAIILASSRGPARPVAFGLSWFALALMPSSSIFPLSEVYNEHRIFFPYIGLALAVTWALSLALRHLAPVGERLSRTATVVLIVVSGAVIAAHGAGTRERNKVWADEESLWRDVTEKSPRNGRGLMNYGLTLMRRGEIQAALDYFTRALEFTPDYPFLEVNLAIAKSAAGQNDAAGAHFRRALELDPGFSRGRYFYADWLTRHSRGPEALEQLRLAVENSPFEIETRGLLMHMYAAVGDRNALLALARETLRMSPSDPAAGAYAEGRIPFAAEEQTAEAYARLGRNRLDLKQWLDAAIINRHAVTLAPDSAVAWNNLGWALGNLGFYDAAAECFRSAFRLDPEMIVARNNLSWALGKSAAPRPSD